MVSAVKMRYVISERVKIDEYDLGQDGWEDFFEILSLRGANQRRKGWGWGSVFQAEGTACAKGFCLRIKKEGQCGQNTGSEKYIK